MDEILSKNKPSVKFTLEEMAAKRPKERPYELEKDLSKVQENCELCQTMPCCPEHCCDWDNCDCGDCDDCGAEKPVEGQAFRRVMNAETCEEEFVATNAPEFFSR